VINTSTIKIGDEASTESYFHQLMFLFLPWRNEKELKLGEISYFKAYEKAIELSNSNQMRFFVEKLDLFKFRREKTQNAINRIRDILKSTDSENVPTSEEAIGGNACNLGVADFVLNTVDPVKMTEKINNLNREQTNTFNKVIQTIEHYEGHRNKTCFCTTNSRPLRLFCSGVGGNIF
jgi:hypothetical protein